MPKYVIEREVPGAGHVDERSLKASRRSPATCSASWGRRYSGSRAR